MLCGRYWPGDCICVIKHFAYVVLCVYAFIFIFS